MHGELRIIFAGGGTGGHVFPAINLARHLKKNWGANCLFVGTRHGLESVKVPQAGFVVQHIWISGFRRSLSLKNLLFPLKLLVSARQSKKIINRFKPDLVIGTGGYVSGPVLRAAVKLGIPTAIQEQNSYPGITTRLLASKVDRVFLAYEESMKYLKGVEKPVITGNPLSVQLNAERHDAHKFFGTEYKKFTLLVFGGSQGAKSINAAVDQALQRNAWPDVQVIWQTGPGKFEMYKEKYRRLKKENVHIFPFIDNMNDAYAAADLAVCRAGAMTLSELAAAGLPAVLVPYPHAAADHQLKNAGTLEEHRAAIVIRDRNGMVKDLIETVKSLSAESNRLQEMAQNMKALHRSDATERIAEELQNLLIEKKRI